MPRFQLFVLPVHQAVGLRKVIVKGTFRDEPRNGQWPQHAISVPAFRSKGFVAAYLPPLVTPLRRLVRKQIIEKKPGQLHALRKNGIVVPAMKQHQHIVGQGVMGVAVDGDHEVGLVYIGLFGDGRQGAVVGGAVLHARHDHRGTRRFQQLTQVQALGQVALRLPEAGRIAQGIRGQRHIPVIRVKPSMTRIDIYTDPRQVLPRSGKGEQPPQQHRKNPPYPFHGTIFSEYTSGYKSPPRAYARQCGRWRATP